MGKYQNFRRKVDAQFDSKDPEKVKRFQKTMAVIGIIIFAIGILGLLLLKAC